FDDAKLNRIILSGLENNYDVLQAVARLAQASALSLQARADRLPQIGLAADSEQIWREGGERENFARIGPAFSWEADVFNRLESIAVARQSEQSARRDDVDAVRLRLSAEIAEAYFDAVSWRNQLTLLEKQIVVDRELLELTQLRFESGLTASVDMLQQSSQLANTESLVPAAEAELRVSENLLDVLMGHAPDGTDQVTDEDVFVDIEKLPFIGVPADLLLQRPDLRSLRNELVAADAEIGRAIAERLPQLTLDGTFFYEDRLLPSGMVASLIGTFIQPLIDWGARKAEVERNRALYVEGLARFTQRYLEAIEDVENALYQERKQREFLTRLETRLRFLEKTVEETTQRYTNGLTDYLPVLDAVKELERLERVIVQQERALLGFRIQLHRALGGGLPLH
ncbi:MAG: efflux transporter outer membrane subunit, partial [Deltaproteobacteria bacterium]|nr:efflux transporter outer membrane subunit [Deltaproteobacteria bacterium]